MRIREQSRTFDAASFVLVVSIVLSCCRCCWYCCCCYCCGPNTAKRLCANDCICFHFAASLMFVTCPSCCVILVSLQRLHGASNGEAHRQRRRQRWWHADGLRSIVCIVDQGGMCPFIVPTHPRTHPLTYNHVNHRSRVNCVLAFLCAVHLSLGCNPFMTCVLCWRCCSLGWAAAANATDGIPHQARWSTGATAHWRHRPRQRQRTPVERQSRVCNVPSPLHASPLVIVAVGLWSWIAPRTADVHLLAAVTVFTLSERARGACRS